MAGTAYNAYRYALANDGNALPPWHELTEGQQIGWHDAAAVSTAMIEEAVDLPWDTLASAAHKEYTQNAKSVSWDAMPQRERVAWNAAVRHVANIMSCDDDGEEDLESHERRWQQWAADRSRPSNERGADGDEDGDVQDAGRRNRPDGAVDGGSRR
jgi:hypothetical protein